MVVVAVVMSVLVVLLTLWGFLAGRTPREPKPVRRTVVAQRIHQITMTVLVTRAGSSGVEATGMRERRSDGARFERGWLVVTGERDKTRIRSVYRIQEVRFDQPTIDGPVRVTCDVVAIGDGPTASVVDAYHLGSFVLDLVDVRRGNFLDGAHATIGTDDLRPLLTGIGRPVKVRGAAGTHNGRHHLEAPR